MFSGQFYEKWLSVRQRNMILLLETITYIGLSDYHKLISIFFKSKVPKLKPKVIFYKNYKKFDEESFLHDLQNKNFSMPSNDPNENYKSITENFLKATDKHAPLKKKLVRSNQGTFRFP